MAHNLKTEKSEAENGEGDSEKCTSLNSEANLQPYKKLSLKRMLLDSLTH